MRARAAVRRLSNFNIIDCIRINFIHVNIEFFTNINYKEYKNVIKFKRLHYE
ncbi:MAG: hypothetical protein PR2021_4230 [Candidatus Phytoplasma pruni]|nr:MAG: hypothetical protein PR2021_4230 [Candidatus Phytoplasma pruni]